MIRTVKLRFNGLMFFHFDDRKMCRVGFHTKAEHHKIIVKVGEEIGAEVKGEALVIPHDVVRTVKHLWLYVAEAGKERELPSSLQISIERGGDKGFENVMDIRECYDSTLDPNWDDVLTPSLHIPVGSFFARTLTDNCKLVNQDEVSNLFFAIFQPTDDNLGVRFDQTKLEYLTRKPKVLAEIIGVDITVEDNQRLVLAIGDENGPGQVLSSIQPEDGLAILIANLPPRRALLPKDFDHPDQDDEQGEDEEEAHEHSGQNSSRQVGIQEQIIGRLPHTFHFLHYYAAFKNTPLHKCVLLGKTDSLENTRGVRPDPPCKGIRGDLP
jgi:hypothetical protein